MVDQSLILDPNFLSSSYDYMIFILDFYVIYNVFIVTNSYMFRSSWSIVLWENLRIWKIKWRSEFVEMHMYLGMLSTLTNGVLCFGQKYFGHSLEAQMHLQSVVCSTKFIKEGLLSNMSYSEKISFSMYWSFHHILDVCPQVINPLTSINWLKTMGDPLGS